MYIYICILYIHQHIYIYTCIQYVQYVIHFKHIKRHTTPTPKHPKTTKKHQKPIFLPRCLTRCVRRLILSQKPGGLGRHGALAASLGEYFWGFTGANLKIWRKRVLFGGKRESAMKNVSKNKITFQEFSPFKRCLRTYVFLHSRVLHPFFVHTGCSMSFMKVTIFLMASHSASNSLPPPPKKKDGQKSTSPGMTPNKTFQKIFKNYVVFYGVKKNPPVDSLTLQKIHHKRVNASSS